jgi:drug/metabolite transporter (DMT)-like permease
VDGDLAILYAVLINVAIWVVFMEVTRQAGPVFFSQFNYIVVLVGFGFGVLMFGERPSVYIWGATALMLLGLTALNWRPKRKAAPA